MQLISKFKEKRIRLLLCVADVFCNYIWVIPLNNKEGITNTNSLQKAFNESKRKPSKIWADKGCEVHNKNMKSLLKVTA